jgi:hypothetical protein
MAEREPFEFGTPKLYVRHVPESQADSPDAAHDTADPFTGFIDVGVTVNGVDIPLTREKAGWIGKRLAQAKASSETGKSSGS